MGVLFDDGVIATVRKGKKVAVVTQYGNLKMPLEHALDFIKMLLGSGIAVGLIGLGEDKSKRFVIRELTQQDLERLDLKELGNAGPAKRS